MQPYQTGAYGRGLGLVDGLVFGSVGVSVLKQGIAAQSCKAVAGGVGWWKVCGMWQTWEIWNIRQKGSPSVYSISSTTSGISSPVVHSGITRHVGAHAKTPEP